MALAVSHHLQAGETASSAAGDAAFRHVLALARSIGPRKTGTEGDRQAADYVRARLEEAGLTASFQEAPVLPYKDGERSLGSRNVIGRLQGSTPETIIVAAQHDSARDSVPRDTTDGP